MSPLLPALALLLAASATAQQLVPEGSDFHNGATLPLAAREEAEVLLDRLDRALAVTDADEAAFVLRTLRAREAPDLVAFGPRTHVPALERAATRLVEAESPLVRERVLAEERAALARLVAERDLSGLVERASRGVALPTAREAAAAAARFCFEAGRWWPARVLAERAGLERLAAAAAARLPASTAPEPWPGPWRAPTWMRYEAGRVEDSGLPFARSGREPGEILLADDSGLLGVTFGDSGDLLRKSFEPFDYAGFVLGLEGFRVPLPTPRAHVLAGPLERLVQPFNVVLFSDWRSAEADREARLLCLDASGARPRRRWMERVGAWADRRTSTAAGTPLVLPDRVLAQVHATGLQSEVRLVALDLDTGERLHETPLVTAPVVSRFGSRQAQFDTADLDKRGHDAPLLERDGLVYAATGRGVLAAVDALTGWPRFAFRYDRLFALDRGTYDRAYLFDTGGWDHEPVRAVGDRVVLAPADSRYLYSLAPLPGPRGHLIRETPLERRGRRHVVGSAPDPREGEPPALLITARTAGRSGLHLVGLDGTPLASAPPYPVGEELTAAPLRTATHALVPTSAGVRVHRLHDLDAPPALLELPDGVPPVARLQALESGLIAFCPEIAGSSDGVQVLFWSADRGGDALRAR